MNIFISCASTGIGAELAKVFSNEKNNIYIISNSRIELLAEVSKLCKLKQAEVIYRIADVRNYEQITEVATDFFSKFGDIDLLIANAGIAQVGDGKLSEISLAKNNMETNYYGVINCVESFLPRMKMQKNQVSIK